MTTVAEFKDLGVEFIKGDEGETFHAHDAEGFNRQKSCFNGDKVTRFAWRPINTLPDNPKFKYERDFSQAEIKWRPSLDQSKAACSFNGVMEKLSADRSLLTEFKNYEDDEIATQKPVFTKEFAVRGGVNVEPIYKPCIVKYEGSKFVVVQDKSGREYSRRKSKLLIRDIDTRTPKQKAVDELSDDLLSAPPHLNSKGVAEILVKLGYRKC